MSADDRIYSHANSTRLRHEVAEGLLYIHSRLNTNTAKILEASAFLYALIEMLDKKGIISIEELNLFKQSVGRRLADEYKKKNMGAMLQNPEYDKYIFHEQVEFDCRPLQPDCRTACCRIPFALSKQDIREGLVRWSLGEPYLIEHCPDGYCVHMDRRSFGCMIYTNRPVPCRAFDCRKDERIWLDFEKRRINPDIEHADWPGCLANQSGSPMGKPANISAH